MRFALAVFQLTIPATLSLFGPRLGWWPLCAASSFRIGVSRGFSWARRTPNRRSRRQVLNFWTDNEVAMRRFYFHLRAGDELVPDEEGIDLPDLSAARREAIEAARELLAEAIKDGRAEVPEAFVIADEEGREIDTVPLAAVLPENLKR